MAIGNVSIQTSGGASTLGVISASGFGFSFLNPLYRYANLTLPYSPNDPGLTFTYNNSTLAPVVLLYARFFNLLNEASVPLVANVGTSAFTTSGTNVSGAQNCLDVRGFGAVGDGVADDTAAIQAALDKAHQNFLGNTSIAGSSMAVTPRLVQSISAQVANGSGTEVQVSLPLPTTLNNALFVAVLSFDYSGTPVVTDNQNNTYVQRAIATNGEFKLQIISATIATAALTTLKVDVAGLQFNSLMTVIVAEMNGPVVPVVPDGTPGITTMTTGGAFSPAAIPATGQNDLILSAAFNSIAAGVTPTTPPELSLIASQSNPQPNGLNGAVPVTVFAFGTTNGNTPVSPKWGGSTWKGNAITIAFRLIPVTAPAQAGFTTVCIPAGVKCKVSPVALDERNFATNSCRFGAAAYSLLIDDGVTLLIDGALIADKNARESKVSGDTSGDFGWFLVMNKAWTTNSSLLSPVKTTVGIQVFDGLITSSANPLNLNFTTSQTDLVFFAETGEFFSVQSPLPAAPAGFTTLPIFGGGTELTAYGLFQPGSQIIAQQSFSYVAQPPAQSGLLAAFKALVGHTPVLTQIASGGGAFTVLSSLTSTVAVPAGALLFAFVVVSHQSLAAGAFLKSVTDDQGNVYFPAASITDAGHQFNGSFFGTGNYLFVCYNPKVVPAQTIHYTFTMSGLVNAASAAIYLVTGVGACGASISWTDYLGGVAFNEGPRNKNIRITGNGQVILNGDIQSTVTSAGGGQLFPTGLARFVCVDSSSIDSLEIVSPFGCAVQWMDSDSPTIDSLFVHDAPNAQATVGVIDPGILETDLLRKATVSNNVIKSCPASRGILDWGCFQSFVSGNTFDTCYTGYEYRDCGGETGYFFTLTPVTQNSEITANKAVNNQTDPATPGPFGSEAGSNGFLFYGGFFSQPNRSSVTGVSFHDNIASNNSTDFSFTTFVSFRTQVNNTFGGNSGPPINNGQNTVTGETPTGTIDGTNKVFTLAHIPITSTMTVYLNGLFEVFGTDYTVSGNQITFAVPPNPGSVVTVTYQYLSGN